MSEQSAILFPVETECLHCKHRQAHDIPHGEWTWVECEACGEGFHFNPSQPETFLLREAIEK